MPCGQAVDNGGYRSGADLLTGARLRLLAADSEYYQHGQDDEPAPRSALRCDKRVANCNRRPSNNDPAVPRTHVASKHRGMLVVAGDRYQLTNHPSEGNHGRR